MQGYSRDFAIRVLEILNADSVSSKLDIQDFPKRVCNKDLVESELSSSNQQRTQQVLILRSMQSYVIRHRPYLESRWFKVSGTG